MNSQPSTQHLEYLHSLVDRQGAQGDTSRRTKQRLRLQGKLAQNRVSLVGDFDFKIFFVFLFKSKPPSIYVSDQIVYSSPKDTRITLDRKEGTDYTKEAVEQICKEDIYQLYAVGFTKLGDNTKHESLYIFPRNDVIRIVAHAFSRWKNHPSAEYRSLDVPYTILADHYAPSLLFRMGDRKGGSQRVVVCNPEQLMGFFAQPIENKVQGRPRAFVIDRFLLRVTQDRLTTWGLGDIDSFLSRYTGDIDPISILDSFPRRLDPRKFLISCTDTFDRITPLAAATKMGDVEGVRFILDIIRPHINQKGPNGLTILMLAVIQGSKEVVQVLLEPHRYIDPFMTCDAGKTAYQYAIDNKREDLATMIQDVVNELQECKLFQS
eukprot:Lithocolla_globosa_v1_NODE_3349_length_1693_cov_15.630037.p1 type:complete len:378 gc:universal NODE_3349_length_1693_cov_15.630037:1243-110(-)